MILTSVISTSVFAGAYVEKTVRPINLASDQMEFMLRVGYNSDMGAGIMLTNTYTLTAVMMN
ncbi:KdgM Oligogalacturonate-specific porin protein [Salmonella enterica subsp. enterica]|uniref:KdgM Oligogalacturonate-specific porin protein n=1 Tax=Salmonella enterica I TaxID=59201 RepID=A0A447TR58_SALET|nr:KdgM Oligogalacturonate-specific porin protein [Salmonella enterica subsp. enterica]